MSHRFFPLNVSYYIYLGIPAPPPLPGMGTTIRKPYFPSLPLPTLNWTPLRSTEHTVFDVRISRKNKNIFLISLFRTWMMSI